MVYFTTVTSQGQISIPAPIRRQLKLEKGRKAVVTIEDGAVRVKPVIDILELQGVFKTKKKIPFQKARAAFEEALARGQV